MAQPDQRSIEPKRGGEVRKCQLRSDGRTGDFSSQRLFLSEALEEEMAQFDQRPIEISRSRHFPQVLQNSSPLLSGIKTFFDAIRKRARLAAPNAETSKVSGARKTLKKQAAPLVREPPPPSLNALPGSGTGAPTPLGEGTQGPSPIDYNLEIEAVFPLDMVFDMQKCAAQKARKIVIGRTLVGRASFKDLHDCLKLHLTAPFSTVTLLTKGYFEVLFEEEEGAKVTRKLATVEWSGWALSFSR